MLSHAPSLPPRSQSLHLPTALAVASPRSSDAAPVERRRLVVPREAPPPPPPQASPCTGGGAPCQERRSSRRIHVAPARLPGRRRLLCGLQRWRPRAPRGSTRGPSVAGITSRPPHRTAPQRSHGIQSTRRLAPQLPRAESAGDGQGEGPVLLVRDLERRRRICFLLRRIGLLLRRIGFHRQRMFLPHLSKEAVNAPELVWQPSTILPSQACLEQTNQKSAGFIS